MDFHSMKSVKSSPEGNSEVCSAISPVGHSARTSKTLQTLIPEIQLEIFGYLSPVFSTCLGLTCKQFYSIHKEIHGKVSLLQGEPCNINGMPIMHVKLYSFLRVWMWKGQNLVWGGRFPSTPLFVAKTRLAQEEKKTRLLVQNKEELEATEIDLEKIIDVLIDRVDRAMSDYRRLTNRSHTTISRTKAGELIQFEETRVTAMMIVYRFVGHAYEAVLESLEQLNDQRLQQRLESFHSKVIAKLGNSADIWALGYKGDNNVMATSAVDSTEQHNEALDINNDPIGL